MSEPSSPDPSHSRFCCPQCGSDSTQKLSAVYETGTSQINTESSHGGVALSGGRLVPMAGGSSTSGTQQTEIAKRAAPPQERDEFGAGCLVASIVIGSPIAALLSCIFVLVVTQENYLSAGLALVAVPLIVIIVAVLHYRRCRGSVMYNRDELPRLKAEWDRKWLCHRCGQKFVPDGQ